MVVVRGFWVPDSELLLLPGFLVCFGSSPLSAVENLLTIPSGKVVVAFARVTKCVRNLVYT